jgi:hypothetical protein
VQDPNENNIVCSVRETVVSFLLAERSEIVHLEVSALSLLVVAVAINPLQCV